jgi:hypothetical protein
VTSYLVISFLHMVLRLIGYSFGILFNPSDSIRWHKVSRSWACLKWMVSS